MKIKNSDILLMLALLWFVLIVGCLFIQVPLSPNQTHQSNHIKVNSENCPSGKVCLDKDAFNTLLLKERTTPVPEITSTRERDMKVLYDPLYPALSRTDRSSYEGILDNTRKRKFNVPTQTNYDTYRLVGYITNDDDQNGRTWKLMGKQRDRNRADFYMIPVNNNYDVKIQITDDIVVGEKLRDIDTIPNEISFKSPLLTDTPYKFVELPKGDLTDDYI